MFLLQSDGMLYSSKVASIQYLLNHMDSMYSLKVISTNAHTYLFKKVATSVNICSYYTTPRMTIVGNHTKYTLSSFALQLCILLDACGNSSNVSKKQPSDFRCRSTYKTATNVVA